MIGNNSYTAQLKSEGSNHKLLRIFSCDDAQVDNASSGSSGFGKNRLARARFLIGLFLCQPFPHSDVMEKKIPETSQITSLALTLEDLTGNAVYLVTSLHLGVMDISASGLAMSSRTSNA